MVNSSRKLDGWRINKVPGATPDAVPGVGWFESRLVTVYAPAATQLKTKARHATNPGWRASLRQRGRGSRSRRASTPSVIVTATGIANIINTETTSSNRSQSQANFAATARTTSH